MRRVVLLVLLALALPIAAFAGQIDITNEYGSVNVTAGGIFTTVASHLESFNGISNPNPAGALGNVTFSTGACLTNCSNLAAGNSTFAGGGFFNVYSASTAFGLPKGYLFKGSFVGPLTWTLDAASTKNNLVFDLSGMIQGTLYTGQTVTGNTVQKVYTISGQLARGIGHISTGDTHLTVPEPGTLGLLGTGLVGIAGMFRRKILGA